MAFWTFHISRFVKPSFLKWDMPNLLKVWHFTFVNITSYGSE